MTITNYTINWSDSTLKAPFTVTGATFNTTASSLTLPGRDAVAWGKVHDENLLHLLENFASAGTPPLNPTIGQQWFNSLTNRTAVYWGSAWHEYGYRRIDSLTAPPGLHFPGDLWYNTTTDFLMVYTNSAVWVKVCGQCSAPTPGPTPTPTPTPSYPAAGTLLTSYCAPVGNPYYYSGTTLVGTYANGTGGTYDNPINVSAPTCGYVAPTPPPPPPPPPSYPAAGTLLGTYCAAAGSPYYYNGTTLMGTYANGTGGSTTSPIDYSSPSCGYVPPAPPPPPSYPPYGTLLSTHCSAYILIGTYANGEGGTYDNPIESNSPSCGWVYQPGYDGFGGGK
jgi:hypothetical protein